MEISRFITKIKSHHGNLQMDVPRRFYLQHFKGDGNVTLRRADGKEWIVKIKSLGLFTHCNTFCNENALKELDIVLFNVIKGSNVLGFEGFHADGCCMKDINPVVNSQMVFNLTGNSIHLTVNSDNPVLLVPNDVKPETMPRNKEVHRASQQQEKTKERVEKEDFSNNEDFDAPPRKKTKLADTENSEPALVRAGQQAEELSNPYYILELSSTHVVDFNLTVPVSMRKELGFPERQTTYKIQGINTNKTDFVLEWNGRRNFSRSIWKDFILDNDLKMGDVCIFELIEFAKKLKLYIFRNPWA